jgi:hypothetical protein
MLVSHRMAARFDLLAGVRYDFAPPVRLGATPVQVHPDGYKVYRGVATFGDVVLDYPDLDPPRAEFRPASEVLSDDALASMVNVPFTLQHPDDLLDETTVRAHEHGSVISATRGGPLGDEMIVLIRVPGLEAQDAIESGLLRELSPGYRAREDKTPGVFKGKRYDVVQRGHRYNHLAGVDMARARTPDGRVAKLDHAAAAYPHASETFTMPPIDPKTITELDLIALGERVDADPADAPAEEVKDADTAAPVGLSDDDVALLKQMSPEGQAMVMAALAGAPTDAEAMAAAALASKVADVPPLDDAAGTVIPSVLPGAAPVAGAPAAMLDAAAVSKMIADAIAAAMGPKPDAAPPAEDDKDAEEVADKKDRAAIDADAVIASARESATRAYNDAAALTEAVRKDGHDNIIGADSAAAVALKVIMDHAPRMTDDAKQALKAGETAAFLRIYGTAEDKRRDSLIDAQGVALFGALRADQNDAPAAFVLPARHAKT